MYKFSFIDEPKYKINAKKGTVTCIQKCRLSDFSNFLNDGKSILIPATIIRKLKKVFKDDSYNTSKEYIFSATAHCNPEDKFDESIGKKIAQTKMRLKVYNRMRDINDVLLDEIKRLSNNYNYASEKTDFLIQREKSHLKELGSKIEKA